MKNIQTTLARTIRLLELDFDSLPSLSADQLREVWDYRQCNLRISDARNMLRSEMERQRNIRATRRCDDDRACGKYIEILNVKKHVLAEHMRTWHQQLTPLHRVSHNVSTSYPYTKPRFRLAGGIIGHVKFNVEEDWEYYSRKYRHPKTTIRNRGVLFVYPRAKVVDVGMGRVELECNWHPVEHFRGNWFLDILAKEFGEHTVEKPLRKVQLHRCFTLRHERSIMGIQIYSRVVADTVYDFCAVRGKDTFHATTAKDAVRGLSKKIKSRALFDSEMLRAEFFDDECLVAGVRFCSAGVRSFCADNQISEDAVISRADLRNIVLKKRKLNYERYGEELRRIGISLNCK